MALTRDDQGLPLDAVTERERARERPAAARPRMHPLHTYLPSGSGSSGLQGYGRESDWEAIDEWNKHRKLHRHFDLAGKEFGTTGLRQYASLRDAYLRHGYGPNPLAFLEGRIVTFEWFGDELTVDKDLKPRLIEAAREFTKHYGESQRGSIKPYTELSGQFFPRLQANSSAISNHAFGRAIDLSAQANGLIANKQIIEVIKAATGRNVGDRMSMVELSESSALFSMIATSEWFDSHQKEGGELGKAIRKHRKELDGLAKHGFSNLDPLFVDAMVRAGFKWGGEYGDRKDAMHFELLPDRPRARR